MTEWITSLLDEGTSKRARYMIVFRSEIEMKAGKGGQVLSNKKGYLWPAEESRAARLTKKQCRAIMRACKEKWEPATTDKMHIVLHPSQRQTK